MWVLETKFRSSGAFTCWVLLAASLVFGDRIVLTHCVEQTGPSLAVIPQPLPPEYYNYRVGHHVCFSAGHLVGVQTQASFPLSPSLWCWVSSLCLENISRHCTGSCVRRAKSVNEQKKMLGPATFLYEICLAPMRGVVVNKEKLPKLRLLAPC